MFWFYLSGWQKNLINSATTRTGGGAHEETEIYYIVSGSGILWLDDESFPVKPGDIIAVSDTSKKSPKFAQIAEQTNGRLVPLWLDVNKEAMSAKITREFQREELDFEIAEHLIIELYSK